MSEDPSEKCSELGTISPVILRSPESHSDQTQITQQADSDHQLVELWLHGRPKHTQRAYRREADRFIDFVEKPLRSVKLMELQSFADHLGESLKPPSVHRAMSAVKSLFTFGFRLGYFKFDTPNFGGDLFDFALGFDLDLGSLGALAKKLEGLRLETLFGWLPASAGGGFAIGFKLRGTGGGSLDLGIEGVLKLVIEKLKIEDFEHGGAKHFAIQAVNARVEVLGQLAGEGTTMVMATHDLRLASKVANEVVFLDAGTVVETGDPREIFTAPRQPRTAKFISTLRAA